MPPRIVPADTIADAIERSQSAEIARLRAALQRIADGAAQRSQSSADILALCAEHGITPTTEVRHVQP